MPQITRLEENRARVQFTQHYQSDIFEDKVVKIILLEYRDKDWKIMSEGIK